MHGHVQEQVLKLSLKHTSFSRSFHGNVFLYVPIDQCVLYFVEHSMNNSCVCVCVLFAAGIKWTDGTERVNDSVIAAGIEWTDGTERVNDSVIAAGIEWTDGTERVNDSVIAAGTEWNVW